MNEQRLIRADELLDPKLKTRVEFTRVPRLRKQPA
jgi:hypothetical protein